MSTPGNFRFRRHSRPRPRIPGNPKQRKQCILKMLGSLSSPPADLKEKTRTHLLSVAVRRPSHLPLRTRFHLHPTFLQTKAKKKLGAPECNLHLRPMFLQTKAKKKLGVPEFNLHLRPMFLQTGNPQRAIQIPFFLLLSKSRQTPRRAVARTPKNPPPQGAKRQSRFIYKKFSSPVPVYSPLPLFSSCFSRD